jgi:hypothetical protein
MNSKAKWVSLILVFVLPLLGSCASSTTKENPRSSLSPRADARIRVEHEVQQLMKSQQEAFDSLSLKMDEYQNTLALCDHLSGEDEGSALATACKEKLRALKLEMEQLSTILQTRE